MADQVLVDTDVFSFFLRANDDRAGLYSAGLSGKNIALSFITVGELYAWSNIRNWGRARRDYLERILSATIILPYDQELCREYGRVKAQLPRGRVIAANDLWIAACAVRHSLRLVTHNPRDYEGISGLNIITEAP